MARSVDDLALLLSVLAGPDPRVPSSQQTPGEVFDRVVAADLTGMRIAVSVDLGGAFQVDHEVAAITQRQSDVFAGAGARVEEAAPQLADRKSTRLNSSHVSISYAVFCL